MKNKQHIVINKDDDEESSYNTMLEARRKLMDLVMMGISAYIITVPLYKI